MTTPTFDTIEAQASYGIGLQVGQQLSESGLQGLLPEALVAGIADALEGKHPAVPVDVVHRALREIHERADAVRRQRFQARLITASRAFVHQKIVTLHFQSVRGFASAEPIRLPTQ